MKYDLLFGKLEGKTTGYVKLYYQLIEKYGLKRAIYITYLYNMSLSKKEDCFFYPEDWIKRDTSLPRQTQYDYKNFFINNDIISIQTDKTGTRKGVKSCIKFYFKNKELFKGDYYTLPRWLIKDSEYHGLGLQRGVIFSAILKKSISGNSDSIIVSMRKIGKIFRIHQRVLLKEIASLEKLGLISTVPSESGTCIFIKYDLYVQYSTYMNSLRRRNLGFLTPELRNLMENL